MKRDILRLFDILADFRELERTNIPVGNLRREIEQNEDEYALPLLMDTFLRIARKGKDDRDFLLKLMNSLINIKEDFEAAKKQLVGQFYYMQKGRIEVIDSIVIRMRDYLAEEQGIPTLIEDEPLSPEELNDMNYGGDIGND